MNKSGVFFLGLPNDIKNLHSITGKLKHSITPTTSNTFFLVGRLSTLI